MNKNILAAIIVGASFILAGLLVGGIYTTTGGGKYGAYRTNRFTGAMTWCLVNSCKSIEVDAFPEPIATSTRVAVAPTRIAPTPPVINFLLESR